MSYKYLKSIKKIVCVGRNYAAHIKEFNNLVPTQPFYFLKPTTSLITPIGAQDVIGTNDKSTFRGFREDGSNPSPIYIPENVEVHHEIELAIIIKNKISNATPDEFSAKDLLDNISGFALTFDLTGRNVQTDAKKKGLPWFLAKGYDTFCPVSHMIPKLDIPGLSNIAIEDIPSKFRLKCFVNDELRQDDHCGMMLNKMHSIVSHITQAVTLEAGDLVLTGTPSGVGALKPGDVIRGQLFFDGQLLIDMHFDCQPRPGHYKYAS